MLVMAAGAQADDLPINTNGIKHENVVIRGAQVFNGCSSKLTAADVLVAGTAVFAGGPKLYRDSISRLKGS